MLSCKAPPRDRKPWSHGPRHGGACCEGEKTEPLGHLACLQEVWPQLWFGKRCTDVMDNFAVPVPHD